MVDFLGVKQSVGKMVTAISELEEFGVVRSRNAVADFAEWLALQMLGGNLAQQQNQEGWDIKTPEDKTVQVKQAFAPQDNSNRWSNMTDPDKFDELILFVFSDQQDVLEIYRCSSTELRPHVQTDNQGYYVRWGKIEEYDVSQRYFQKVEIIRPFLAETLARNLESGK